MGGRGATSSTGKSAPYETQLRDMFEREASRIRASSQSVMARDTASVLEQGAALIDSGRGRQLVDDRDFLELRRVMDRTYDANGQTRVISNMRNLSGDGSKRPLGLGADEWAAARADFAAARDRVTQKGYTEGEIAAGVALYRHLRRRS